jgi:hypothetical protein
MPSLVKVWNDNIYPHTERFKGEEITIPAKGYVEMDFIDAVDFQGQFTSMKKTGTGGDDPRGFKMIRVERPAEPLFKDDAQVFHATGKSFGSPSEMAAFARAFAAANPDLVAKEAEKGAAADTVTVSKSDFEALMARIGALESAQTEKRGPGRPKKEA